MDTIKKHISLSLLAIMSFFWGSIAQEYNFKHLGYEEGLSQNSVLSLHQDHLQRIWIGTREGLNCFNGESLKVFQPIANDPNSVLDYKIIDITQIDHILWTLSEGGITKLDLDTMKFEKFPFNKTTSMCAYGKSLFVGTQTEGLYQFNTETNTYKSLPGVVSKNNPIKKIRAYGDIIFIGTKTKGLIKYSQKDNRTDYFLEDKADNITAIHQDKSKNLWIGTEFDGIYVFNENMEPLNQIGLYSKTKLPSNDIRDIIEDKSGRLWVSTFKGISIIDPFKETTTNIQPSVSNPRSLSHNSVFDLMLDKQGNLWAGTYFGGVNYTNIENQPFTYYYGDQDTNSQPNSFVIGNMVEDKENNIWIATEGRGLNHLNTKTGKFSLYENTASLNYNIRSILLTDDQKLYMGTHFNGLIKLDLKTGISKKYINNSQSNERIPIRINNIIKYNENLLIGSRNGLFMFNTDKETFSDDLLLAGKKIKESIYSLYQDSENKLWIGTVGQGLICYNPKDKSLKRYVNSIENSNSIAANTVYKTTEDHLSRLWVGTIGGGLSMYRKDSDDFVSYTKEKDNLPSNFIYGIQKGDKNDLWISTSNGLSHLDIQENKFNNYTRENGFPNIELNQGGLLLSKKGELYMGGLQGLFSVDENTLLTESEHFNLVFSKLQVNNKEIFAKDASNILDADISIAQTINLKSNQNSFSLEYASCNYNRSFNKYQYQLEGFDEGWIDAGSSTKINYTNLSPGAYNLKVRAVDLIHNSPISEKIVALQIAYPFYRKWYAYLAYFLIIGGLIWLMVFAQQSFNRLRLERKEKETIMELNHYKLQFFTNISHEIMTPLTLILGCLEIVEESKKIPAALAEKLKIAHKNAINLKNLSLEFLDFRKMESGYIQLKVKEYNIISFLKEIAFAFSDQAEKRNIKIELNLPKNEEIKILFDSFQLEKVFYNLISNAFKAVKSDSGVITISVNDLPNEVAILVKDNGSGIKDGDVKNVFKRYYHIPSTNNPKTRGSGIGLALSESIMNSHNGNLLIAKSNANGTIFKVTLKKGTSHFDKEELKLGAIEKEIGTVANEITITDNSNNDVVSEKTDENKSLPTILVIEDNPELQQLLKDVLETNSNVQLASDGREGLDKALSITPDLIILDVMIPEISGMELCKILKRNINTSHIPIILLTAKSAMESKVEGLTSGADDYITKPFSIIYLKARIKNLFENRSRLHAKYGQEEQIDIKEIVQNETDIKFMNESEQILERNYTNEHFNVDDFAREAGLSRTLFFKKIKSITGSTPNQYIQIYRLRKASELLSSNPNKNVSEIAYDVGFGSPKYFSKCFKDFYGMVPREYVKE